MLLHICMVLNLVLAIIGVWLMQEKMRGKSSTSYVIISVMTTLTASNFLLDMYLVAFHISPCSDTIHAFRITQQIFLLIGASVCYWRLYKTFKLGFCHKAYACPIIDDAIQPLHMGLTLTQADCHVNQRTNNH
jgi:hypothetical protein